MVIDKLCKLANALDKKEFYVWANELDSIIFSLAHTARTITSWEGIYEYILGVAPQYGIKHMDKDIAKRYAINLHMYFSEVTNIDPNHNVYMNLTAMVRDFFITMRRDLEQEWPKHRRELTNKMMTEQIQKYVKITPKVQQSINFEIDKIMQNKAFSSLDANDADEKLWASLSIKAAERIIRQFRHR